MLAEKVSVVETRLEQNIRKQIHGNKIVTISYSCKCRPSINCLYAVERWPKRYMPGFRPIFFGDEAERIAVSSCRLPGCALFSPFEWVRDEVRRVVEQSVSLFFHARRCPGVDLRVVEVLLIGMRTPTVICLRSHGCYPLLASAAKLGNVI